MKEKRYIMVWMAAVVVFALSTAAASWVFSGVNVWTAAGMMGSTSGGTSGGAAGSLPGNERLPAGGSVTGRPVIVIDPGHGGMDGGAVDAAGTAEKDLTLAIARALAEEMAEYPADVIMTRESDQALYTDDERTIREKKREDLLRRKEIIEEAGAELAVSIHLNSFPQDESVYGAQVFYPKSHKGRTNVSGEERTSADYAEKVQKALEINIDDGRTREVMTKDDILLFKNINTNIILVECGFLSNPAEAEKLRTAEYQHLLARAIWQGINEILCLEKTDDVEVIDSKNKNS